MDYLDFSKLTFGGDNETFRVYERNNGSFEEAYQYEINSKIKDVKMDKVGLYYFVTAIDNNLYTFFECPSECLSCSFPNNCSACTHGYLLDKNQCILKIEK